MTCNVPPCGATSAVSDIMLHVLLVVTMLAFAYGLLRLTFDTGGNQVELVMRLAALATGTLVVVGSDAAGVGYSDWIMRSLATTKTLPVGIYGSLIPGAAGIALGWFIVRNLESRRSDLAMRFIALVGMLAFVEFVKSYLIGVQTRRLEAIALPNLSFVLSLLFYMVARIRSRRTVVARTTDTLLRRFGRTGGGQEEIR